MLFGVSANAQVMMETDMTSLFSSLTQNTSWTTIAGGTAGYTGTEYCPKVTPNGLPEVQVCEYYYWSCSAIGDKPYTGDVLYATVNGLPEGTYKIELYGGAAFCFGRGFGSTAFTGDLAVDNNDSYTAGDKITPTTEVSTGVTLYAQSEGITYGGEIPIYYATNFPDGAATVTLNGVVVGASGTIKIGMSKTSTSTNWHVIQLKSVIATVDGGTIISNLKTAATALLTKYTFVTGAARTDLETAVAATPADETQEAYQNVIDDLEAAITAFDNARIVTFDGVYYIQNASTGKFMAAGHNYGTRGIVDEIGLDFTLAASAGKVTFDSQIANGADKHFLGSNLYMDSPTNNWIIRKESENTYSIGNGTQFIGIDGDDNLAMVSTPVEWQFVLPTTRLTALSAATEASGVDATFLLKAPNFGRGDQRLDAAWAVSADCTNKNLKGGKQENMCAESFHSVFTISQSVTGAPAGYYKMTAQGFYRQDDGATEPVPVFFANGATGNVLPKTGEEGSMDDASTSFSAGQYTIAPIQFYVDEDGKMTVGIKNETAEHQWIIFDNFRLTYYGPSISKTIDEDVDFSVVSDLKNANITLKRTIKADTWKTIALPFDVTNAELIAQFGADTQIAEYSEASADANAATVNFNKMATPAITANTPVLLKTSTGGTSYSFTGKTIKAGAAKVAGTNFDFVGTYAASTTIAANDWFIGSDKLWKSTGATTIKGTRAYITAHTDGARIVNFFIDGVETTGIEGLEAAQTENGKIYNLAGQEVKKAQKGLYIQNGKKMVVR